MHINVLGSCDTRPMIYTLMKLAQSIGDVLLITSNRRLLRLSNTGESMGHYQNVMIGIAETEGVDDFWDNFPYNAADFETIIVDHIIDVESDITIICEGMIKTEEDALLRDQLEDPIVCPMFSKNVKYFDENTLYNLEEFEALQNMCLPSLNLAKDLSKVLAPRLNMSQKTVLSILKQKQIPEAAKKGLFGR